MLDKVTQLLQKAEGFTPKSKKELEEFRLSFLGKKGFLNELFAAFKDVSIENKKEFGQAINKLKQSVQSKIEEFKGSFDEENNDDEIDFTRPISLDNLGSRHPISLITKKNS